MTIHESKELDFYSDSRHIKCINLKVTHKTGLLKITE